VDIAASGLQERPVTQTSTSGVATGSTEWLIMVYQAGDNSLDDQTIKDVTEMEKVGSSDRIKIVVLMDRVSNREWTTTRRFLVQKSAKPGQKRSWDTSLPTCKDLGELNMGDPATLRNFVTWARQEYPARRSMLVLWNHGGGWRSAMQKAVTRFTRAPEESVNPGIALLSRGIAWDDTSNGDFLESREVRTALAGFPKLDILAADACLMAMVECAYEWRDLAAYYVASQDVEPGSGWSYADAFAPMQADPGMKTEALAKHLVRAYADSYPPGMAVTHSAIQLDKVKPLGDAIDALAGLLLDHRRTGGKIPAGIFDVQAFPANAGQSGFDFLDLDSILENIACTATLPPPLRDSALEARRRLADASLSNSSSPPIKGRGLSIFGGATNEKQDYRPDIILFARDTRWDEFIMTGMPSRGSSEAVSTDSRTGGTTPAPGRWAVLIGVNDYADSKIPDLAYAEADVTALRDALVHSAGYDTNRIFTLINSEATVESVRTMLGTEIPRKVSPGDMVTIYFSGHGAAEPSSRGESEDGTEKYMLLANSKVDDLYGTALPMSELARIFGRIRSDKILLLMDSCYSGAVQGQRLMRGGTPVARLSDDYLSRLSRSQGTVVITASRASERSLESPTLRHGVFTHYLLNVFKNLADSNHDGITTVMEGFQYLVTTVTAEAGRMGGAQQPMMKGEMTGDWPLVGELVAETKSD
jgi:hypothetical protein